MRACENCVVLIRSEPEATRAERLDSSCPDCACEHGSVGLLEGATRVDDAEALYSVIVTPPDEVDGHQLLLTMLTHAETSGLSVLRAQASDEEFVRVAQLRIAGGAARGQRRTVVGVAEFACADIRQLRADGQDSGRALGARLFCIYDTDDESAFHADILQTSPRGLGKNATQARRKKDRQRLLEVYRRATVIRAENFRGGFLSRVSVSP